MSRNSKWQFWIDRGGTFTDVVAVEPGGEIEAIKLLSDNPGQYADAAAEGLSRILQRWSDSGRPDAPVEAIKMGTTVATNALLERNGVPTVLIVTRGFADGLAIGYQNRPDIFALKIEKPPELYKQVIEVEERLGADGRVLTELDEPSLTTALQQCLADGIECAAHMSNALRPLRRKQDMHTSPYLTRSNLSSSSSAALKQHSQMLT
jgi:5-oxoprolinase (ATP-hydrolysing)